MIEIDQAVFEGAVVLLRTCRGAHRAMTIEQIGERLGLSDRRLTEALLETRLADFPFPLVAGSRGYYIPTSAADINAYMAALRSRALKVFLRRRRVLRAAERAGWPRAGREFCDPPSVQGDLFTMQQTNPIR